MLSTRIHGRPVHRSEPPCGQAQFGQKPSIGVFQHERAAVEFDHTARQRQAKAYSVRKPLADRTSDSESLQNLFSPVRADPLSVVCEVQFHRPIVDKRGRNDDPLSAMSDEVRHQT